MHISQFNWVDCGFIIIFVVSLLFGFARGFIKEAVSLFFLMAAVYLAIKYSSPMAARYIGGSGDQAISYLILVGVFFLIFIATILVGAVAGYLLGMIFQSGGLGFINSFLGGIFGVARAVAISVVIVYLVQLMPANTQPKMWGQSQAVMYFQPMTGWLVRNISPALQSLKDKMSQTVQKFESGF